MAEIIKSIKSSGGDYTTLAAWEASISANPTDDQTASIDEAFNAGTLTIDVANSNVVKFKITVAAAYRFYNASVRHRYFIAHRRWCNHSCHKYSERC